MKRNKTYNTNIFLWRNLDLLFEHVLQVDLHAQTTIENSTFEILTCFKDNKLKDNDYNLTVS